MLQDNGLFCNASKLISFSFDLFQDTPWSLGLDPDEIYKLSKLYEETDPHLSRRLNWLSWQVRYAIDFYKKDLTYPEWHPCEDALRPGESIPFIHPKLFQECLDSAISPLIIILNFQSYHSRHHVKNFLGYTPNDCSGWITWGVNPYTGVTDENVIIHCKPDIAYITKDGKEAKYLCPSPKRTGKTIGLVFLNTGIDGYWEKVICSDTPVTITEGIKKAASGLSNLPENPTIAVLGTCMGIDKVKCYDDYYGTEKIYKPKEGLKDLINSNRLIYIAFDSDAVIKDSVSKAVTTLGESIEKEKGQVKVIVWDNSPETKGMDDLIHSQGIEAFKIALSNALSLEGYIDWIEDKKLDKEKEKLLKDLEKYCKQEDPSKKTILKTRLIKKYSLDRYGKEFDNLLSAIQSPIDDPDLEGIALPKVRPVSEIIQDDSIGKVEYIVDELIAHGNLTMLTATSGVGKSLFAYNLARAVAIGEGEFATRKVLKQCKVLFLQCDEPNQVTKERLENLDMDSLSIEVIMSTEAWSYNGNGLRQLEKLIKDNNYGLVIIDNLDDVKPDSLKSLSDPEAGTVLMTPLKKLASKYNTCFVVINHTPKNEPDKYVGSWTLNKPLFSNITLKKDSPTSSVIYLTEDKARFHKAKKLKYVMNDIGELSDFEDISSHSQESKSTKESKLTAKEKIIEVINDSLEEKFKAWRKDSSKDKPVSFESTEVVFKVAEIVERTGLSKPTVTNVFKDLVTEGMLISDKRGEYTITQLFCKKY